MMKIYYKDFESDLQEAMAQMRPAFCTTYMGGTLEFTFDYGDMIPVYTGVSFMGDRECYMEPEWSEVAEVTFYKPDGSYENVELIYD